MNLTGITPESHMFTQLPHQVQENIAYKLNVLDRTKLNSVLPLAKRFIREYDKPIGILYKAICRGKIKGLSAKLQQFVYSLPKDEQTIIEIKKAMPDMFTNEMLDNERKDRIFAILPICSIETYKSLLNDPFYSDFFTDQAVLYTFLWQCVMYNQCLLRYILTHELATYKTALDTFIQESFKSMLRQTQSCQVIIEHMQFSKEFLEELYIDSIQAFHIETADMIETHLKQMT